MFCFVFEWLPVHIAWPLYSNITGSFGSEVIVLLWIPHVCTLPLSACLCLSHPYFLYFYTLLCVYICMHCMCFHSIDNAPVSIAAMIASCMTDKYCSLGTSPLGPWRNDNGQPLDNVIHWRSIHKSNIGSHLVYRPLCSCGGRTRIKRKQGMTYVQA